MTYRDRTKPKDSTTMVDKINIPHIKNGKSLKLNYKWIGKNYGLPPSFNKTGIFTQLIKIIGNT